MAAKTVNFLLEQGTTFSKNFAVLKTNGAYENLTGHVAQSQMRKYPSSASSNTFTSTISNAVAGTITISMSNTATANLSPGNYFYDIETTNTLSSSNTVARHFKGIVTVDPEFSKW